MKRVVATRLEATAAENAVQPMGSDNARNLRRDSLIGAGAAAGATAALGAPDGAAEPAVIGAAAGFVTAAGDAGAVGCVAGGTVSGFTGAAGDGGTAFESLGSVMNETSPRLPYFVFGGSRGGSPPLHSGGRIHFGRRVKKH